jgi:hypothetical protein
MIEFLEQHAATSAAKIEAFEAARDIKLPDDYRTFILRVNGGKGPKQPLVNVLPGVATRLTEFKGLLEREAHSIMRTELGNFSEEAERLFVQIAEDQGGNLFVLDTRPEAFGAIYFFETNGMAKGDAKVSLEHLEPEDHEEASLLHPVAENFSKFVGLLQSD